MKNKTKRFDVSADYYQNYRFTLKLRWNRTPCDFNILIKFHIRKISQSLLPLNSFIISLKTII